MMKKKAVGLASLITDDLIQAVDELIIRDQSKKYGSKISSDLCFI